MATDFRPNLPAATVDNALRGAITTYDHARRNLALWFADALERNLYRDLGFASMEIYARQGLGFSPGRTRQFLALSRNLRRMPHLRDAVTEGRLGWTKAQEVARVVTPDTEKAWVDKAVNLSREDLRKEMTMARTRAKQRRQNAAQLDNTAPPPAGDPPTTITITLDSLQRAHFDALFTAAKKSGAVAATASRAEVILASLGALTDTPQAVRRHAPAATVIVQRCPDCKAVFALSSSGPKRLDKAAAAAIACDHIQRDPSGHNRSAIPPAVRRNVLDRDGHRCTSPGCSNTQFLDIHHLVPRSKGGLNALENLKTLCSRCHHYIHARTPAQSRNETSSP